MANLTASILIVLMQYYWQNSTIVLYLLSSCIGMGVVLCMLDGESLYLFCFIFLVCFVFVVVGLFLCFILCGFGLFVVVVVVVVLFCFVFFVFDEGVCVCVFWCVFCFVVLCGICI